MSFTNVKLFENHNHFIDKRTLTIHSMAMVDFAKNINLSIISNGKLLNNIDHSVSLRILPLIRSNRPSKCPGTAAFIEKNGWASYKHRVKSGSQDMVVSARIQASELLSHFKVTLPNQTNSPNNCDTPEFAFHSLLILFF